MAWFYARPLFWVGLAAVVGAALAGQWAVPLPLWMGVALVGGLLARLRAWELGGALAAAGFYGVLATVAAAPPAEPWLQPGSPAILQGKVVRSWRAGKEHRMVLVQVERRRTVTGWVPARVRVACRAPDPELREGHRIELSGLLRRPREAGNPGEPSDRRRWRQKRVHYLIEVKPEALQVLDRAPPGGVRGLALAVRERVLAVNRATLPPRNAYLVNQFLIGDVDPPPETDAEKLQQAFRDSGTIHLLVISGSQVTLLLAGFVWLGWRLFFLRHWFWSGGALVLVFFCLIAEGGAAVARAGVMGALVVLGLLTGSESDGENALGLAALVQLGLDPLLVESISAQLSFVAVWSLCRLGPEFYRVLGPPELDEELSGPSTLLYHRAHDRAARLLAGTLSVHLALTPLLDWHLHYSAWISLIANLVLVLLAGPFLLVALLHTLLALAGADWLSGWVRALSDSLAAWAEWFAGSPLAGAPVFPPPVWLLPLLALLLLLPGVFSLSRAGMLAWTCLMSGVLLASERVPAPPPGAPRIRVIDVGQGDALLLESSDGARVLVDTGPPEAAPRLLRTLRTLRIPALDAVLLSHVHLDHTGGLKEIVEAMPIRLVLCRQIGAPADWEVVLHPVRQRRIRLQEPQAGDRLRLGESVLQILGPLKVIASEETTSVNNGCLVGSWSEGNRRVLLVGDLEAGGEQALLPWGAVLRAEVLKVAHHGSRTSTIPEFLAAVQPRVALISCGPENRHGHPHPEALGRLARAGIPHRVTAEEGMLTVTFPPGAGPHVAGFRRLEYREREGE